ncbi:MAG: protein serine/threonine phosphatase 2C family protein [Legionellales bacterium]
MQGKTSIPQHGVTVAKGEDRTYGFAYCEDQHARSTQEDALTWQPLTQKQLTAKGKSGPLTPEQIGHRLWTSYHQLDDQLSQLQHGGTTASTTVYDGRGNLITATLADAVAFAAIYDTQNNVVGVVRLNHVTHSPEDPSEWERIHSSGGMIQTDIYGTRRVGGTLAITRAIGDNSFKGQGVCADAAIDITNVTALASKVGINSDAIGKIQIITTCDGFTERVVPQTKKAHEAFLLGALRNMRSPGTLTEIALAEALVDVAKKSGSTDNISVAIQTITTDTPPFLLGLFDGHGGKEASVYAANNIVEVFKNQCQLRPDSYEQQVWSVGNNKPIYKRDNSRNNQTPVEAAVDELLSLTQSYEKHLDHNNPLHKQIGPVLVTLVAILTDGRQTDEVKIEQFYQCLEQKPTSDIGNKAETNLDLIKQDKNVSSINFALGIAIVFTTLVTGILPGLLISCLVYSKTGSSPLDLFKGNSTRFAKHLDALKQGGESGEPKTGNTPGSTT